MLLIGQVTKVAGYFALSDVNVQTKPQHAPRCSGREFLVGMLVEVLSGPAVNIYCSSWPWYQTPHSGEGEPRVGASDGYTGSGCQLGSNRPTRSSAVPFADPASCKTAGSRAHAGNEALATCRLVCAFVKFGFADQGGDLSQCLSLPVEDRRV